MAELTEKSATDKAQKVVEQKKQQLSAEEMLEKYQKPALIGLGVLVAIVAAFSFYMYNQSQNDLKAQAEMYQAVFYFEQDSLDLALKGIEKKDIRGLQDIADEYTGTKAGKLASFYTGIIYLRKGKYEDAISYLEKYDSEEGLYQARAWSLIGDAYSELNDSENAIKFYKKASDYKANEQITPSYLMKLGLQYELNKDWKDAGEAYDRIIKEFPKAQEVGDAKKYKAKVLQALLASE